MIVVADCSLLLAGVCFFIIVADIVRGNWQHMWIMNIVWPVTALYAGPLALWTYFRFGKLSTEANFKAAKARGEENPGKKKPESAMIAVAATHCGSGCTLGDIMAEWLLFFVPFTLFGMKIFAAWTIDYAFAFILGIVFQYFTIVPMRNLSPGKGIVAALKADSLSLTSWQIGMYGWMAIATFAIFGREIDKTSSVFWFMMQIAMLAGFLTSYPVNAWLLKRGLKEKM